MDHLISLSCTSGLFITLTYFQINLYDRRLMRGAIQSYLGNKNSHSRIQLGVDSSETMVMSGSYGFIDACISTIEKCEHLLKDTLVRWRGLSFAAMEYQIWRTAIR